MATRLCKLRYPSHHNLVGTLAAVEPTMFAHRGFVVCVQGGSNDAFTGAVAQRNA